MHCSLSFTLVMCGKVHPVEMARHLGTSLKIIYSADPYSISGDQLSEILKAEQEQSQAYLHGMSKAAQHKLHYTLYCQDSNVTVF